MVAKYGQIVESAKFNQVIYDCFEYLCEKEQKKFLKKFRDLPHSKIQVMHTFRELLLGAYLRANGLIVENERNVHGKTPDWSVLDSFSNITAIVEMVNHHIDNKTNEDILAQRKAGKKAIGYWPNSNDPDHQRLYSQVLEKASKYKNLVAKIKVPYVIAVFIDFLAVIDVMEVKDCFMIGDEPLFKLFPDLSGILYFVESNLGSYFFELIENPYALRKVEIPTGYFLKS